MVVFLYLSTKSIRLNISNKETELIESALKGDQSAYKQLYDLHVDGLYCFLSQFADNNTQSEEWTQRAFIKAFKKLGSFKQNSKFKTWLFTIGLNEMRSDMRKKIQFTEIENMHLEEEQEEPIIESPIWLKAKEAIKQLAPQKRIICLLHIAESYSHAEIAAMIGISEAASKTTLHRAKKELQLIVEQ